MVGVVGVDGVVGVLRAVSVQIQIFVVRVVRS